MTLSTRSFFLATATALGVLALTTRAHAIELVNNGGFETGNLSGWTQGGNLGFTGASASGAHTGNFGLLTGPVGSTGTLSQILATTAGQSYTFSYWLTNFGGPTNSFAVTWGPDTSPLPPPTPPTVLNSFTNAGSFGWTQFSHSIVASTTSTLIQFEYRQDPSFWALDDVSVTSNSTALTPEMPGGTLLLAALLPMGFLAMKKRRKGTSL